MTERQKLAVSHMAAVVGLTDALRLIESRLPSETQGMKIVLEAARRTLESELADRLNLIHHYLSP